MAADPYRDGRRSSFLRAAPLRRSDKNVVVDKYRRLVQVRPSDETVPIRQGRRCIVVPLCGWWGGGVPPSITVHLPVVGGVDRCVVARTRYGKTIERFTLLPFFISAFGDDSIRAKRNRGEGSRDTIRVGKHFRLSIAPTYITRNTGVGQRIRICKSI